VLARYGQAVVGREGQAVSDWDWLKLCAWADAAFSNHRRAAGVDRIRRYLDTHPDLPATHSWDEIYILAVAEEASRGTE